jgi:hypothetical protein
VGFPDVIAQLQNQDGTARLALIIEVKHGASKSGASGAAHADASSESPDATEGDRRYGDQLAKYWQAGCQRFHRPAVIYLTHDRWLPKEDVEESLCEAGAEADIFWLSWFALYRWASNQLAMIPARPTSEARILQTLCDYLAANAYRCFLGWSSPPLADICQAQDNHPSGVTPPPGLPRATSYTRTYELDRLMIPASPLHFYRVH